jgi:predicted XRE-type DNA-binding protein
MKIDSVVHSNRKKAFCVVAEGKTWWFPYAKTETQPTRDDPVASVYVDSELANEGFTFVLRSGREDSILMDQVLDYNRDPGYMRNHLLYSLTLEAQRRIAASRLSRREIIRRMGTSAPQLYRLLDQTNHSKSVDQMLNLLNVLDCEVDLVVHAKVA